ncbi:MAG: TldD/PmbA family protein [Polyangiaceae bacterium]|nr:TldD/PmbA family protein [Polyangiaceae bacterium]
MSAAALAELIGAALREAGEPEAEIHARDVRRGYARFAVGELCQHMQLVEPACTVRVARGKRVGEASTTALDPVGLRAAIEEATRVAERVPEEPAFPGFAPPPSAEPTLPRRYAESTARATAEERVARLEPVLRAIRDAGLVASGALETRVEHEAVVATTGLRRHHSGTVAAFRVWALERAGGPGAAGHGNATSIDVDALGLAAETERAIRDARAGRDPGGIEAGEHDVVLAPDAVAELIEWLAMIAFGAREIAQGTSALAGRLGEAISGERLDVRDEPLGALSLAGPFDREGTTRAAVTLLERGVARGALTDRLWGSRVGSPSTGSAHPPSAFEPGGIGPTALVVAGGEAESEAELIRQAGHGLYVRRLHYVNGMLEPRRAVMTGLVRDGAFRIEGGALGRPVRSPRFTDSVLEAFARCEGATRARTLIPNWWSAAGSVAAPAVLLRRLRFSAGSR